MLSKSLRAQESLTDLGRRLVAMGEQAYTLRQMGALKEASNLLIALPLPPAFRGIGLYYKGLHALREGQVEESRLLFERSIPSLGQHYRARALSSISSSYRYKADVDSAWCYAREAWSVATHRGRVDPAATAIVQQNFALLKSESGDHKAALKDLKTMFPLVEMTSRALPRNYYVYLNSIAVELGELGRIDEAQRLCQVTLASPLAHAYPEWIETSRDLKLKARHKASWISIPDLSAHRSQNVVPLRPRHQPESDANSTSATAESAARVLKFVRRAAATVQASSKRSHSHLSRKQKILKIMDSICAQHVSDEQLGHILGYVEVVLSPSDCS